MPTFDTIFGRPEGLRKGLIRCAISDRQRIPGVEISDYIRLLFQTSADVVQWREKDLPREVNRRNVRLGVTLARQTGKFFSVNTHIQLALEEKADGAHLTGLQSMRDAVRLRSCFGRPEFRLGQSVHSAKEAQHSAREGADYLLLSPVFKPLSKTSSIPPLGLDGLAEIVAEIAVPVLALGGITPKMEESLVPTGVVGWAGISWVHNEIREQHPDTKRL